jgi:hypothetical protein
VRLPPSLIASLPPCACALKDDHHPRFRWPGCSSSGWACGSGGRESESGGHGRGSGSGGAGSVASASAAARLRQRRGLMRQRSRNGMDLCAGSCMVARAQAAARAWAPASVWARRLLCLLVPHLVALQDRGSVPRGSGSSRSGLHVVVPVGGWGTALARLLGWGCLVPS